MSDDTTEAMRERFIKHSAKVDTTSGAMRVYHMSVARGLYKVLRARFYAGEGDALPIGAAPHWMIYSEEQMRTMR